MQAQILIIEARYKALTRTYNLHLYCIEKDYVEKHKLGYGYWIGYWVIIFILFTTVFCQ
jgi:hypothetical protein